jgi:hypothetical protein
MKHLHLTLGYLREQRARLDTSIALLETLVGANGNGHTNGNGHRATLSNAADALALLGAHATTTKRTTKPKATTTKRKRAPAVMRPLPDVTVPSGLHLGGLELPAAIAATLKAYKKPADTKTLAALLLGAGFEWSASQPLTTRVGLLCGKGYVEGVKGSTTGWRLR